MEKFLKVIGRELYERVWLSYKSTLLGILFFAAIEMLTSVNAQLATIPKPWAHTAATLCLLVLGLMKSSSVKVPPAPTVPPTGGFATARMLFVVMLGFFLVLPSIVLAQSVPVSVITAPSTSTPATTQPPLAISLGNGWTLEPGLALTALAYDVTTHSLLGQVTFSGLYALVTPVDLGVAGGGSISIGSTVGLTATGALLSPKLPFGLGAKSGDRIAALVNYVWMGPAHDVQLGLAYEVNLGF